MSNQRIKIIQTDITTLNIDAIVNAAKTNLLGGGGVDGAIHRAAGAKLREECIKLGGCSTGDSKLTNGYNLSAKYVIHTVGPRYNDGNHNEADLLKKCYISCLNLAVNNNIKTIAFPSISTGVYGYPIEKAAEIALSTILEFLKTNNSMEQVYAVCFSDNDLEIYTTTIEKLSK